MNPPFLFIHIPKTAGTSFRKALESSLGKNKICCDYGKHAAETSGLVRTVVYKEEDCYRFKKAFDRNDYSIMAGHFHFERYGPLFELSNVVTFVRDPVRRVVSEYLHHQRHKNYKKDLIDFCRQTKHINILNRYFSGVHWPALGFIGLTEQYEQSLSLFNEVVDFDLPVLTENFAPNRQKRKLDLDCDVEEQIRILNANDVQLYQRMKSQFDQRIILKRSGLPFTHGAWSKNDVGLVHGFAFRIGEEAPLLINIIHNGVLVSQIKASGFEKSLARCLSPRRAYVGFRARLDSWKEGDSLILEVDDTRQGLIYIGGN